jgi:hypothetical protein
MHIYDSHMTYEEYGDTGTQGKTTLKFVRMWTLLTVTTTIVLNRIKDGTSNKGRTTKVTIKVTLKLIIITSINHF